MRRPIVVASALCAMVVVARADISADRFAEGQKLLDKGDAVAACAKFAEALEARPDAPGILLNLGLCNLKQHKIATALKWFRQAQLRAAERGQTATENAAKQHTVQLAARVPTIKLELSAPLPDGALVQLDGVMVDRMSFGRVEVDAGRHTLTVSGPGLETTEQQIDVPDGPSANTVPLTVRAAATTKPPTIGENKPAAPPPEPPAKRGHGLAIGLAAGSVVAFTVGGWFLWDAAYLADQRDKALAACTLERPCSGALIDDYDRRGQRANVIGIAGLVAGGALLAGSALLFATSPRDTVAVAPLPGGAMISRAFTW